MATDEEYLDNLLKAVTQETESRTEEKNDHIEEPEVPVAEPEQSELPSEAEAFSGEQGTEPETDESASEEITAEEPMPGEPTLEEPVTEETAASVAAPEEQEAEPEDWKSGIDDLLAQAEADVKDEKKSEEWDEIEPAEESTKEQELQKDEESKEDVEDLSGGDILNYLAGLNGVDLGQKDESSETAEEESASPAETRKEKRARKKREKKEEKARKKAKMAEQPEQEQQDENQDQEALVEPVLQEKTEEQAKKQKAPGFWNKLFHFLTEEVQEEPEAVPGETEDQSEAAAENPEELEAIPEKEEKNKKKNKKGKKKKEKDAGAGENDEEGEEAQPDEKTRKKQEKARLKQEKKEKKLQQAETEKPVRVLSQKQLLILVAFCASLIACIVLFSYLLPDFSDKAAAREAYYAGDYERAYELLYDKGTNASDTLIFNRARTVLTLDRKLSSYKNNRELGRNLEALDALLQGVSCYEELVKTDEYGVKKELDGLYQQICECLQTEYGISPEEADEINTYDSKTYTRKLDSVINGTEFTLPGQEKQKEPEGPRDILPEEEEIISL